MCVCVCVCVCSVACYSALRLPAVGKHRDWLRRTQILSRKLGTATYLSRSETLDSSFTANAVYFNVKHSKFETGSNKFAQIQCAEPWGYITTGSRAINPTYSSSGQLWVVQEVPWITG